MKNTCILRSHRSKLASLWRIKILILILILSPFFSTVASYLWHIKKCLRKDSWQLSVDHKVNFEIILMSNYLNSYVLINFLILQIPTVSLNITLCSIILWTLFHEIIYPSPNLEPCQSFHIDMHEYGAFTHNNTCEIIRMCMIWGVLYQCFLEFSMWSMKC